MKRILFLIHDLGYGGAERVLVNLVNNIDKSEFDVTVQTLFDVGVNKEYLNNSVHYIGGLKKMFRGNVPLMKLFSPKALCKMVIKEDYDLVVSFLEGPCSRIVSAYEGKKIAWIHTVHSSTEDVAYSFRNVNEMIDCYNSFDKIACVADTVKVNFIEFSKTQTECLTLYNVNSIDKIIEKSNENQNTIVKSEGCFNIVSTGRLINSIKGFDRLISVHKRLLENGVNNKLYILGEGEDHQRLIDLIEAESLKESCFLMGFQDNPYKYIKNADLFVCSSYREGFSTAVTEALVLGVPVVSTEVSGAKELLGDNNEYGIVTDNNEDALYEGIRYILSDHNLVEFTEKAIIRGKDFSIEKSVKAIEKTFKDLLCDNGVENC